MAASAAAATVPILINSATASTDVGSFAFEVVSMTTGTIGLELIRWIRSVKRGAIGNHITIASMTGNTCQCPSVIAGVEAARAGADSTRVLACTVIKCVRWRPAGCYMTGVALYRGSKMAVCWLRCRAATGYMAAITRADGTCIMNPAATNEG